MDKITVGMKITLARDIDSSKHVGSTATIVYIDDFDQIFVDWSEGGQSKFSEKEFLKYFDIAA